MPVPRPRSRLAASERPPDLGLFEERPPALRAAVRAAAGDARTSETDPLPVPNATTASCAGSRWWRRTTWPTTRCAASSPTAATSPTGSRPTQTVRASEERLRALLANISDVISVSTPTAACGTRARPSSGSTATRKASGPRASTSSTPCTPTTVERVFELWDGLALDARRVPPVRDPVAQGRRHRGCTRRSSPTTCSTTRRSTGSSSRPATSPQRKESEEALRASEAPAARERGALPRRRRRSDRVRVPLPPRRDADVHQPGVRRVLRMPPATTSPASKLVDLRPASERAADARVAGHVRRGRVGAHARRAGGRRSTDRCAGTSGPTGRSRTTRARSSSSSRSGTTSPISGAPPSSPCTRPRSSSRSRAACRSTRPCSTIARALEDQFPRFSCAIMLLDPPTRTTMPRGATLRAASRRRSRRVCSSRSTARRSRESSRLERRRRVPPRARVRATTSPTDDRWADHREIVARARSARGVVGPDPRERRRRRARHARRVRRASRACPTTSIGRSSCCSRSSRRSRSNARRSRNGSRTSRCTTRSPDCRTACCSSTASSQAIARCRRTQSSVGVAFLDLDRFKNVNDSLGPRRRRRAARRGRAQARVGDPSRRHRCPFRRRRVHRSCAKTCRRDDRARAARSRSPSACSRRSSARSSCAAPRCSWARVSASRWRRRATSVRRSCSATPTPRCTTPRRRGAAGSRCSTTRCARRALDRARDRERAAPRARARRVPALLPADRRACRMRVASAPRRWCAGSTRSAGCSRRPSSSRWPRRPAWSCRSGWWVLEEAARATRPAGSSSSPSRSRSSVNLSARQLAQPDLADRVAEVIAETGVQPSSLCFEITESVLMDDAETVLDVISRVRALGVQFAIDDFGTGYSSLGYLKRFPVDSVKIDRSFVSGLGAGSRRRRDRVGGHRPRARARAAGDRRGRRDRGAARRADRARLRRGAGLLLLAAAARARPAQPDRADAHVAPAGRRRDAAGRDTGVRPIGAGNTMPAMHGATVRRIRRRSAAVGRDAVGHRAHRPRLHAEPLRAGAVRGGAEGRGRHPRRGDRRSREPTCCSKSG